MRSLVFGVVGLVGFIGCASSQHHNSSQVPDAWKLRDAQICSSGSHRLEPLVVDFDAHERADLEDSMRTGLPLVKYDCKSMVLLKGCSVPGDYHYVLTEKKEQLLRMENSFDVSANIPIHGFSIIDKISGGMSDSSTLDISLVLVGKKTTFVNKVSKSSINNQECLNATHFVRGAYVGAFAVGVGNVNEKSLGVGIFSASDKNAHLGKFKEGDPKSCEQSRTDLSDPPQGCRGIVRLELVSIGSSPVDSLASDVGCMEGFVFSDGKCVEAKKAKSRLCKLNDTAECVQECSKGHAGSCSHLGFSYASGANGLPKDLNKAVEYFKFGCNNGNSLGCVMWGVSMINFEFSTESGLLLRGKESLSKDEAKGISLLRNACEGGDGFGCWALGAIQEKSNLSEAKKYFSRACDAGNSHGCSSMAEIFRKGDAKDLAQSFEFYQKSCKLGAILSCGIVADAYSKDKNNFNVKKDQKKSLEIYENLCEGGHFCNELGGVLYLSEDSNLHERGVGLIQKSICSGERGYSKNCPELGMSYLTGLMAPKDEAMAFSIFKAGCENEDIPSSCERLGSMFEKGNFKDVAKAFSAYKKSCSPNSFSGFSSIACVKLGDLYRDGLGVKKDDAMAISLYQRVCDEEKKNFDTDKGIQKDFACLQMGAMMADGRGEEVNQKKAAAIFSKICGQNSDNILVNCGYLGFNYEKGLGVKMDRKKAISLYESGCQLDGNPWVCAKFKKLTGKKLSMQVLQPWI